MNIFLRAKHWQLFLFGFALPILIQLILMVSIISAAMHNQVDVFHSIFAVFPFVMLLFMGVHFGWFWAVGVGLQYRLPEGVKMNVPLFKFFFFVPLVYIFCLLAGVAWFVTSISTFNPQSILPIFAAMAIIIPLHFFAIFCIFYCVYFVAKTFRTIELQRPLSFGDYAGEFFMVWFFPIGLWIMQPKINKMIEPDYEPNPY